MSQLPNFREKSLAEHESDQITKTMDECLKVMVGSLKSAWSLLWQNSHVTAQQIFDSDGPVESLRKLHGGAAMVAAISDIAEKMTMLSARAGENKTYTFESLMGSAKYATTLHPISIDPVSGAVTVLNPEPTAPEIP